MGSLNYICTTVRPDINQAISRCSQLLADPRPEHAKHIYHLIRYMFSTAGRKLEYEPTSHSGLEDHSDSNFADASDRRRRSTSGTIVTLHGRPVAWKSKRQTCTADSGGSLRRAFLRLGTR